MEDISDNQDIVDKLTKGMQFGLFNKGKECYFADGTRISYADLWKALRVIHNLPPGHHKTLAELCPDSFMGNRKHSFLRHRWQVIWTKLARIVRRVGTTEMLP